MAVAAHIQSVQPPACGQVRKGCAAARRHPSARPNPRRHRARAGGRGGLRAGRADPQGLDPLSSRQRSRRAARARGDARQPQRRPDACRSCAPTAISRISPTSPRTSITSAATAPMRSRARRRGRARSPTPSSARARWGSTPEALARLLRSRPGEPGAHRPSDRSAAQEHADPRDRDRRICSTSASRAVDPAELAANEEQLQARGADPVAHQSSAPDEAQGHRRGRQRALVLRLHVLSRAAAPLRRDRGQARRDLRRAAGKADRLVPAGRLVDRRRPRRQSVRHRRRAQRDRCASRARGRSATISTNCTNSAPNCRSPPISPR